MRPPRYPLEPLVRVREEAVDAAVRGLAAAVTARGAAERQRQASERRREDHERAAARARAAEAAALARGELRAGDLAAGGAWELRVASERAALQADLDRAKGVEVRALEAERGARSETAARQADSKVVEKDRGRWQDAQTKRTEAKEEEEAAEAYRPVR